MDIAEAQARIDAITWYHEFDFPNGLTARSKAAQIDFHRALWGFIKQELDRIDFAGKAVLDVGCWDGYWSFYAERRGASHVLASDDRTQNWAQSSGLLLAKDLMNSRIETNLDVSIYALDELDAKFDIILCLGVYYHLIDPLYAFAQIRHRCHEETVVVIEGDVTTGMRPHTAQIDFSNDALPIFIPTRECLKTLILAAYFEIVSQAFFVPPVETISDNRDRLPAGMNRALTICHPFRGTNAMQGHKPPFGLSTYDPRWSGS